MKENSMITCKKAAIVTNNIHCERHVQYFSTIEKYLKINGWIISDHFNVDRIILCSCGFHDAMYEKVKQTLEEIRKTNFLEKNIVIMACLTKTHRQDLERDFKGQIVSFHNEELLDKAIQARVPFKDISPVNLFNVHEECGCENKKNENFHIKISEGCLRQCTFCIINKAKGYLKSFPWETIEAQVGKAIKSGSKKIYLMGEDTFAYGIDTGTTIIELARKIRDLDPGLEIFFGYLHARWLKKYAAEIIALCKEGIITELQIGLQHVNEELLERMGRPVEFDEIYDIIAAIKREKPGFYFIMDILVGFPGETEAMFSELVEFFKKDTYFDKVKHFAYSDVKGAPSAGFENKLSREVIAARWQRLDSILGERSYSSESGEDRIDNETFRKTRFDDYFFCKDTFDESINEDIAVENLAFAKSMAEKESKGDFGF